MASSFSWKRKNISAEEYAEKMGISSSDNNESQKFKVSVEEKDGKYEAVIDKELLDAINGSSINSNAYKAASDIRKFEIDKYWQRTLYFWGFISAIYIAYFNVLKEFCSHGSIPLLVLSALGLFFCFSWFLASKGSKHWQENWENHLDMLENDITGPLYKTYKAGDSYSVSQINIMAGIILSLCAYGLFMFECANFVNYILKLKGLLAVCISALFMIVIAVALFVYSQNVKGNVKNSGSIEFDFKKYGD